MKKWNDAIIISVNAVQAALAAVRNFCPYGTDLDKIIDKRRLGI